MKKALFLFTAIALAFAPGLMAAATTSDLWYLAYIPAAPLSFLSFRQYWLLDSKDFADAMGEGIKSGLEKYFNSPSFPEAMDRAFEGACASLADEAEAAGQRNLATGYRIFGGLPPKQQVLGTVTMNRSGKAINVAMESEDSPEMLRANAEACFPDFKGSAGKFTLQDDMLHFDYRREGDFVVAVLVMTPRRHEFV